jgi:hypothetical protein
VVPEAMADRLKSRRGRIFHSTPQIHASADVLSFALEVRAASFLLLLLTLASLGCDIASLAKRPQVLRDFSMFFKRPDRKEASTAM